MSNVEFQGGWQRPTVPGFGDSKPQPQLRIIVTIAVMWSCWYAWRFFLVPRLHPDEPAELPYLIPVVGHVWSMFTGAHRLFSRGRKQFGAKPWSVTVMGESMYVVDSPEDVSAVYKAPKTLDFDPFVKDILGKYGVTHDTLAKLFARPQEDVKSWMDASLESMKMQLHPGEKLDTLQKDLLGYVDEALTWDKLQGRMVVQEGSKEKVVSLYDWAAMVIADGQTRALFDPVIYKLCPDIVHQIQMYEEEGWKLPLDLPSFATKAMRASQAYIEAGLIRYMELPDDERPRESWLFRKLCTETLALDIDKAQAAKVLFPLYRVVNANAYRHSFWTITYLLFDETLQNDIRQEIKPAFTSRGSPDLDYLFKSCPLLASTCEEALRLTIWSMGSREVISESIIGGKRLKEGRKVLMPYRAMHFDSQVFGDDPNNFNPRRFMERKNLIKSPSYRPFGGAAHYCPFIARREVQMFVAIILMRFELEAVGKDGKEPRFPKMDDSLPTGGVQGLVKGEEVPVRVRTSKPDLS